MVTISNKILSDITIYMKYARYLKHKKRRETWFEIVTRNKDMHLKKYPELKDEIEAAYKLVYDKKVLPSMRSLQFAGKSIEMSPNRVYNCAFLPIDSPESFSETMFLLLGGTGVGFSVQTFHVKKLPAIKAPGKPKRFLIGDSIEGWADSVKALLSAYFEGAYLPKFDFSDIRSKGALLVTSGGKAPGPQPLIDCLHNLKKVLDTIPLGGKVSPINAHDMMCFIADAVLAGGIRRAALISLFNLDDDFMLASKYNSWWELNPQRARANNSVVLLRHKIKKSDFSELWKKIELSKSGEPGIYFSNDKEWGTNPSLRSGTKVLTTNGIFPIEQLQDTEFEVKNIDGKISKAKCWLSGKNKQLHKITLVGGHEYYATDVHEWPIYDGENFIKIKSKDLESGMMLPNLTEKSLYTSSTNGTYNDGLLIGWNLGDGWISHRKDSNKISYGFIFSEKDINCGISDTIINHINFISDKKEYQTKGKKNKFGNIEITLGNKNIDKFFKHFGITNKSNGFGEEIWKNTSEDFKKGLIDGLFSSDGCFSAGRVTFKSKHKKLMSDLAELLGFYGIKTLVKYGIQNLPKFPNGKIYNKQYSCYRMRLANRKSVEHFRDIFKISISYKQDNLSLMYTDKIRYDKLIEKNHKFIEIESVESTNLYENVWDISVYDNTHCFQISHCITGNCCEIALRSFQFCNLTEINAGDIENQADLNERAKAATLLGTLQAGYTDFHYLREIWKETTEKDALIGVGITGIANGKILSLSLREASNIVVKENERIAKIIGINKAARTCTVKPSGTSSLVVGSSSGVHAWHDRYYVRRIRVGKNEAIYKYLSKKHPELVEDDYFKPHIQAVISIPQEAPTEAIFRTESPLDLLNRAKKFAIEWVRNGHMKGSNTHNVSVTVSVKNDEWEKVGEWMWDNKEYYNGISVLPYDDHTYVQAPFESITKEKYEQMMKILKDVDLTKVVEEEDNTDLQGEQACAGGSSCEII